MQNKIKTILIVIGLIVVVGGGYLVKTNQENSVLWQEVQKKEGAQNNVSKKPDYYYQTGIDFGQMTEESLPNAEKIINKPSVATLKEFRKRSEELEKQAATFAQLPTIKVGDTPVSVDLVYTFERQKQGLDSFDSLPKDQGMLYVFQMDDADRLFGTQLMKFPLDFIWVNSDLKIVHITKNVPAGYSGDLKSLWPARYVLEVNAGFADEHHISVGTTIDLGTAPH